MAVIGNAPFQGLVSGGNIIDASIEGVDLSTSAIAARLGYTPVDPGSPSFTNIIDINKTGASAAIGFRRSNTYEGYITGTSGGGLQFQVGSGLLYNVSIDATGNLGVGTASPALKLDVAGSIKMSGGTGTALTWDTAIGSQYLKYDSTFNGLILSGYSGLGFRVLGATTDAMRLDSSGNLGLGVTPSTWTNVKVFESGYSSSFGGNITASVAYVVSNGNFNGGWLYKTTGPASYYRVDGSAGAHVWYNAPSGTAGNALTWTQAMTLDASGNLGLGVTPSAWGSAWKAYQYIGGSMASPNGSNNLILQNAYNDGTNYRYVGTAAASSYQQSAGSHIWNQAPSGTAGNAITFTQAMTLDASGNLMVGTSTPSAGPYQVKTYGTVNSGIFFENASAGSAIAQNNYDVYFDINRSSATSGSLVFRRTSSFSESMRIGSSGNVAIGTTETGVGKLNIGLAGTTITGNTTGTTMGAGAIVQLNNSNAANTNSTVMLLGGGTSSTVGQISSGFGFSRENGEVHWGTQIRFYTHPPDTTALSTLNEVMRIDSTGRLLIGTTTQSQTGNLLEINRSQSGGTIAHIVNTSTSTTYAEATLAVSAYNTGILLGAVGANVTTYGIPTIAGLAPAGVAYLMQFSSAPMAINHYAAQPIVFGTGNSERMRVGSTGNIGIGTTATYNSAKVSIAGELEARGSIKSYQSSRGGLASGASVVVLSIPNGNYGTEVSMTIYISQREDGVGNLSSTTYNITAFGSGGVAITPQGSATYGGGKSFSLTAASGSGGFTVTLNNTAGGGASTGLFMAANVLVGYGAITWGW